MLSTTYLLSALLALAPLVSAHGAVRRIAVGETIYTGPAPGTGSTAPSPIRQIANNGPVLDPTSAAGVAVPAPETRSCVHDG
jgi:hypothetical protein